MMAAVKSAFLIIWWPDLALWPQILLKPFFYTELTCLQHFLIVVEKQK